MKSKTTTLLLSILVGEFGIDRFYLGYTGMGVLKLFTGGCFGILYILDIINIVTGKLTPADGSEYNDDFAITSVPAKPAASAYDELEKIAKLHETGALSDEEFSKLKADILERM